MSRHTHRDTRRNREIGLVHRKREQQQQQQSDQWKQTNLQREFEELRKTLAVAQNTDQEWQKERNEIGMIVKLIEEKRTILGNLMRHNQSPQERILLYRFLLNQKKSLDLVNEETNKHYLLNVNFSEIPAPFLF